MPDSKTTATSTAPARVGTAARQAMVTAAAGWLSYSSSTLIGLHEGYWAAISAIVVMQSDLTDAKNSGRDRFIGTAIGGLVGWGCAACWHQQAWIYALAVGLTFRGASRSHWRSCW